MSGSTSGSGGPCGACKFLRRKCVAECVFAPYFDSEEGTSHFTAVHKVFGASNASKLLMMIPASRRLDAVVTLTYEALARLRDPVYGCVGHIFALQHQVMNLQAELAYVQTQLSTLQGLPPPNPQNNSRTEAASSSNAPLIPSVDNKSIVSSASLHIPCMSQQQQQEQPKEAIEVSTELVDLSTLFGLEDPVDEDGDLNALAREFLSKYLTGGKCRPSSPI
ncbi:Lateral organ boundaries LOB [Arabidopsis thaliana x Arabidopsis arenosa]|uniref:Lateral organ boundaries LOB n=1 Tax=Arabidopsis thaliana x Arabidopsis arenosa TaxID=1240361 RepID=A0A8T1Z5G6_9BRAS|nr:Lateral organ boundaries LOB [Arabidopsis thaliana x Arabidopsis arenosa]